MRQRRSGCIINVATIGGHIAVSPPAAYSASKFAVEALSECLAQEAKPFNVRVAIIEPGIIDTPMAHHISTAPGLSPYPQQRRMALSERKFGAKPYTRPRLTTPVHPLLTQHHIWRALGIRAAHAKYGMLVRRCRRRL